MGWVMTPLAGRRKVEKCGGGVNAIFLVFPLYTPCPLCYYTNAIAKSFSKERGVNEAR
jgi:hypothetical protein